MSVKKDSIRACFANYLPVKALTKACDEEETWDGCDDGHCLKGPQHDLRRLL